MGTKTPGGGPVLTLVWPWLLLLLPLPWVYRHLRRSLNQQMPALRSPLYMAMARDEKSIGRSTHRTKLWLLAIIWLALVLAAARPTWVGDARDLSRTGRDLLLAVDLSESMRARDMVAADGSATDRLTVVKEIVGEFVRQREGDRIGLILFGTRAYLQSPPTYDHETLLALLNDARIGFPGGATAIGDTIGLAVKRLRERPDRGRVLILLSDGADTASQIKPHQAASLAAAHNLRIYTIGIGSEGGGRPGVLGALARGASSDLDEETLTAIAEATGGRYFRARDTEELAEVYSTIDTLEPIDQEAERVRPTRSLFHWPLGAAFVTTLLLLALHSRRPANA